MPVPEELLEKIEALTQELNRYSYLLELPEGISIHTTLDRQNNRQHAKLSFNRKPAGVEVFWEQKKGYARKLTCDIWHRLEGAPYPDLLERTVAMLRAVEEPVLDEIDGTISIGWHVDSAPIKDDPAAFFDCFFGEATSDQIERFKQVASELSETLDQEIIVQIDAKTHEILNVSVRSNLQDIEHEMFVGFLAGSVDLPGLPETALDPAEPALPAFMLLFDLPKWGWSQTINHGPWAQASLDLIESEDDKQKYTAVTNKIWSSEKFNLKAAQANGGTSPSPAKHHPIVLGSVFEDYGDLPAKPYTDWFVDDANYKNDAKYYAAQPYERDYHHYGGGAEGVMFRWYFPLRQIEDGGKMPLPTKLGPRYYSARDWGFGGGRIDPKLNRLTFIEAIRQYNQNTFEGRRRAYLMLGHALHLLQDQGQPDHARLVDHAGSSKSEDEIFDYVCPIIAGEIAIIVAGSMPLCVGLAYFGCLAGAFTVAMTACKSTVNPNQVGYEKLIKEYPPKAAANKALHAADYDNFFEKMAKFSDSATAMKSALGCSSLTVGPFPTVPNINPDIDSKNPKETKPYLDLTKKLIPKIIGYGAGLIQHFHQIVNPPPIVQRLAIVQWEPGDKPKEFAVFNPKDKDHCLRYDAEWAPSGKGRVLKIKKLKNKNRVSNDRAIYIFVQFGPTEVVPDTGRRMKETMLRIRGKDLFTGKTIDEEVILTEDHDPKVGTYYWGSYLPRNCSKDPMSMTIEVSGKDSGVHLEARDFPGDELDSDPSTIAIVDSAGSPKFPFKNYVPGTDTTHGFIIGKLEWNGFSMQFPQPGFETEKEAKPHRRSADCTVGKECFITLAIHQQRRDCVWELQPGRVTCPVAWKVETKLQDVELVGGGIRIRPNRRICKPGIYSIAITCKLGSLSHTEVVKVRVL